MAPSADDIDALLAPLAAPLRRSADHLLDLRSAARTGTTPGRCIRCYFELLAAAPSAVQPRLTPLRAWLEARIEAATGDSVANPWDAKDAVMATALYMKDLGAGAQTYSAERKAAAMYYAGSNWAKYGLSYAASVLSFADDYQKNIDFLTQNNL